LAFVSLYNRKLKIKRPVQNTIDITGTISFIKGSFLKKLTIGKLVNRRNRIKNPSPEILKIVMITF